MNKFNILYPLFCAIVFGIISGGLFFAYSKIGIDPLTLYPIPHELYYYRDTNSSVIIKVDNRQIRLEGIYFTKTPIDECQILFLNIDIIKESIGFSSSPISNQMCKIT